MSSQAYNYTRVAVTGVGGGCGQGIMKALFQASIPIEVYPVDVTPLSVGLYRGRAGGTVLPKPECDIDAWRAWVAEKRIQIIFPGSDHDLVPLAKVAWEWRTQGLTEVVVSNVQACAMANDKALTAWALRVAELPHPCTWSGQGNPPDVYPLVLKPRSGMTSRGVQVIHDREERDFYLRRTPSPMLQAYIEGDEYTCSVLCDRRGEPKAAFIMRRDLYAGSTYTAEVVEYPALAAFLFDVVRRLRKQHYIFYGGINFQLRVRDEIPYIFEINARSSGSTAIRAGFGYNEPEQLVKYALYGGILHQPDTKTGVAFRFWEEAFIEGVAFEGVRHSDRRLKAKVHSWL